MKTKFKFFLIAFLLVSSTRLFAQRISLGDKVGDVSNILRDRIRHYYNAQNSDGMETGINLKHYNGEISEIDVWIKNGFLYDLQLTADYTTRYIMSDGKLDYISTQYANLSVEKIRNSFNSLYGKRHIGNFYFEEDYASYKMITLGKRGLATVEQISTSTTRFPDTVADLLQNVGVINHFTTLRNKNGINQNALYNNANSNLPKRYFVSNPHIDNINRLNGKVVVDITVNKLGDVIDANANLKSTTIADSVFLRMCEGVLKKSKLNAVSRPDVQKAQYTFTFKVY
jgi:sporulation protein YlmC with PRC-barrel domain